MEKRNNKIFSYNFVACPLYGEERKALGSFLRVFHLGLRRRRNHPGPIGSRWKRPRMGEPFHLGPEGSDPPAGVGPGGFKDMFISLNIDRPKPAGGGRAL